MATSKTYPSLTADEEAALIPNGAMVAVSGFTPAGAPKAVPRALAKRARERHQAGAAFQVKLLSGASTGAACDDELAGAEAVSWRAPYMTSAPMPIPKDRVRRDWTFSKVREHVERRLRWFFA